MLRRSINPLAAPRDSKPCISNEFGHFVKTLRVARHDQPLRCLQSTLFFELLQQLHFFALSTAGKQQHRLLQTLAPDCCTTQLQLIGLHVKFEIAKHRADLCTHIAQPLGIVFGLRPDSSQRTVGRARNRPDLQCTRFRLGVEPGIGQRQWNASVGAGRNQIGPDFRFHQHAHRRAKLLDKAARGTQAVPGKPDLQITRMQQLGALFAACGRAVGQKQTHIGQPLAQSLNQNGSGTGLTQRHRVNPDPLLTSVVSQINRAVMPKAFSHSNAITGFCHGAPLQFAAQQRLGCPGQCAVDSASESHGRRLALNGWH